MCCRFQGLHGTLQAAELMDKQGLTVSRETIYYLLQECAKEKDLTASRRVHFLMKKRDLDSVPVLGNHLIRLYSSCGCLEEASAAFASVSKPTLFTWNALLAAYLKHGETKMAFYVYFKMLDKGVKPDVVAFLTILKACNNIQAVGQGHLIHDHIIQNGLSSDISIGNTLIDMYAKFGVLKEAHQIFNSLPKQTVVSFAALIDGYASNGQGFLAMELFTEMQEEGVCPDKVIFLGILKACGSMGSVENGRIIHNHVVINGLCADAVVGNTLVDMYAKCGSLEEAHAVFNGLSEYTIVSWGALISGYVQHGDGFSALELFKRMEEGGMKPDRITLLCILKAVVAVKAIDQGRFIHKKIHDTGFKNDIVVMNAVIDMYAKCGSLDLAYGVFKELQHPDAGSWGAIIGGYVLAGDCYSALKFFEQMQENHVKPSEATLSAVLKACATSGGLCQGRKIHGMIYENGSCSNVMILNTLIDMYFKCRSLEEAQQVFDTLETQNAVTWGVMVSGYALHGHGHTALEFFQKMKVEGIAPSKSVLSSALKACSSIKAVYEGRLIHEQVVNTGDELDVIIGSSLVDMYAKCDYIEEAQKVFDELQDRDIVSWAAMVAGYAVHGYAVPALRIFAEMLENGVIPDKVTYLCALKACGSLGVLVQGQLLHDQIIVHEYEIDSPVANTLIDMYAKCGTLSDAWKLFDNLPDRNLVTWNAIISLHAQHGDFNTVQNYLDNMQLIGLKPDQVIFTNILTACSQTGQLATGQQFFNAMIEKYDMAPNAEQYSCMIDLFGRAGCFKEAVDHIESMPGSPDFIVWVSLLTSCRLYRNIELGRQCLDQILKLKPDDASGYVLMSNIYADAQMWEKVDKLQELRKHAVAWKKPGMAWVEANNNTREFVVGGKGQLQTEELLFMLLRLNKMLKKDGYWPQLDTVTHQTSGEVMEDLLWAM